MLPRVDELVLITISLASAVLAIAVYSRAPDRVWNRLFAVQAAAVSIWVAMNYLLQASTTPAQADLWLRLTHPASALVICTFADIFWVFPERIEPAPFPRRAVLYTLGFLASCVALAPNLYRSLHFGQGTVVVDYDWPFLLFGAFAVGTVVYADIFLLRKLPRLTGLQRVQVGYVLAGAATGQTLTLFTNVLLPLVWHNTYYSRWGAGAYIFVIGSVAYAIAKHGIIRPAVAASRVSAYLLTGLVLVAGLFVVRSIEPFLFVNSAFTDLGYAVPCICIGILAVPLHQRIRQKLEQSLPGADLFDAARAASDAIVRTLDGEELPGFLARGILQMLKATHVAVFFFDARTGMFVVRARSASGASEGAIPEVLPPASLLPTTVLKTRDLLDRTQILRFQSLREARPLLSALREMDVEVAAPILWENDLIGLVLIGERVAGDMYSPDELQILRNLLPQVSLAVRNAQLFDEVVRMNDYNENVLRQMQSGVVAVNSDREIVTFNPAAEEILGISADRAIGNSLAVLPERIAGRLALALSGHAVRSEDRLEIDNARGGRIPVACSISRTRGTPLSQEGALAVINDLTLIEELERERQDAEHLATIRLLSAGMAHELRNPLVAIRTFAELLPSHWDDAEFRMSFLGTAQDEIDRIDRLLTDMLMLSKPADAVVEAISVDAVCEGVARTMSAAAEAKQVRLVTELQFGDEQCFIGDRSRLHQALVNLVKNAIEAEPEGGFVQVTSCLAWNNEQAPVVRIVVHNANSYIPEELISDIFRPFSSRRQGGTGLGLSVCQTIIEEHQGLIKVDSRPETGTDFIVELPVQAG